MTPIFRILLGTLLLFAFNLKAQRTEFGIMFGGSYYIGDLNPKTHFLQTQPAGGLLYRHNINPRFAYKANLYLGMVYGEDVKSKFNPERNLSFRSIIGEFGAQFEFNFLPYIAGNPKFPHSPYVFAGIAVFRFNPQANYNGRWHNLQPLGTEGQGTSVYSAPPYSRKPYSLTSVALPFGVGAKLTIAKNICMAIEYGLRTTSTDYLDDVSTTYPDIAIMKAENGDLAARMSNRMIIPEDEKIAKTGTQRGNSKNNDWYAFAVATFTIRLNAKAKEHCPAYNSRRKPKYSIRDYKPQ